ncbi:uncharacterized acetyltransferase At3g50280-like [Vicia villosa]|uniref:uncharacterized acetyltransferase At3g50280-like n=1 Tax=Vicia villosa TaxID=3911 RepID=UPI00273B1A47|nr:uncharacterized acetyltransferase At3g50280-like [Vicia villosa]
MSSVQILSTTIIQAPNHNLNLSNHHTIDLTPWDLQYLPFGYNQIGLIYQHNSELDTENQIQHLKQSLSSTLEFFPPFTGRLDITEHEDNTISCSIKCNNEGALFVHAANKNISVRDILGPTYLPDIFYSFFQLNGVKNYQGTSHPLLAIQVTELTDGIVIGCAISHVVVDGTSLWHFINSWAKISKGNFEISKIPSLERWFSNDIQRPIRFHFPIEPHNRLSNNQNDEEEKLKAPMSERLFHLSKENIAKLKSKANLEAGTKNISSLQAVFTHVWRCIIRSKNLDPQEKLNFVIDIGVRPRFIPPLPEEYFGNAVMECVVTVKVGELLEDGGLGKCALKMNKIIALHSDEKLKNHYEDWLIAPSFVFNDGDVGNSNSLAIGSSPWFDVYGNDFGWGKPVAVRNGGANKKNGKIYVSAGIEEGSINLEVCLDYEILEAIGNDYEFMDDVCS